MAQEIITLECTEAKALGKPVSRYMSKRNKKRPAARKRQNVRAGRALPARAEPPR